MKKLFFILYSINFIALGDETILKENQELSEILSKNTYEPNYFGMLFGLFIVIGLIYLTGYLYQKLIKVDVANSKSEFNKAKVISTTPLGQNKNLHVIKVNDKYMLIASCQNSINFIKDIEYIENSENEKCNQDS